MISLSKCFKYKKGNYELHVTAKQPNVEDELADTPKKNKKIKENNGKAEYEPM